MNLDSFFDELLKIAETEQVEKARRNSVATIAELKKTLKSGDLLFTAPRREKLKSTFGKYVFKPISRAVQRTDFGHTAIYVGNGKVVDTRMGEGTKEVSLKTVATKNKIVAMRPKVSWEERRKAIKYARGRKGKPYSTKDLVKTLNPFRGHRHGRKPEDKDAQICSAVVANAYAGRKFSNTPRLLTRPAEILKSKRLKPVAALEQS